MPGTRHLLAIACLLGTVAACSTLPPPRPGASVATPKALHVPRPPVLLVSIDGLGANMFDPVVMPRLARLGREGVQARWMRPAYPSLTFPNHHTMVTGLRPDRHGIVHNTMRDPVLERFSQGNRAAAGDGRWWGGTPAWVAAERAGRPTATFFWPGTEADVQGVRPSRWRAFDPDIPPGERVRTVVDWLSEPAATRPHLATLYFEHVDQAAHAHGPHSPQARTAMRTIDAALGDLLDGLGRHGPAGGVDLIVVSDHGLARVEPAHAVALEDMADPADAEPVSAGQSVGFIPRPGRIEAAEAQLLGRHEHYECWRREAVPARWQYGRHPRVPPIVCQMDEGWDALPRERMAARLAGGARGSHGYDPALASMRAVFFAHGPSLRRGVLLPAFDSVDVYPLLMHLLDLPPEPHDGDDDALAALRLDQSKPAKTLAPD